MKGFRYKDKRGITPVIATILLILLVIILFIIIFWWVMRSVDEQIEKFGSPIRDSCTSVDLTIKEIQGGEPGSEDYPSPGVHYLDIVNTGNVDVKSLDIRMFKGGEEVTLDFDFPIDIGASVREPVTFSMNGKVGGPYPDKIIVYPVLMGEGKSEGSYKVFTCLNEGRTIVDDTPF